MAKKMKLRRIGNSLGTTFSKEVLQQAGFTANEELDVAVLPGEIRIKRASGRLVLELSKSEANALASGKSEGKALESLRTKARKLVHPATE